MIYIDKHNTLFLTFKKIVYLSNMKTVISIILMDLMGVNKGAW